MNTNAQKNYNTYVNSVFFNAFSTTPDSSIVGFLKSYAPMLMDLQIGSSKWTAYPVDEIIIPQIITHSYVFNKHPFINADIRQGEFKIYTNVYKNAIGLKDIQLIIEFEKLNDAERLFEKLRKDLIDLAKEQTYYEDSSKKFSSIYSNEMTNDSPASVKLILIKGQGITNLYQLSINVN